MLLESVGLACVPHRLDAQVSAATTVSVLDIRDAPFAAKSQLSDARIRTTSADTFGRRNVRGLLDGGAVTLDPKDVEAIAQRVAELTAPQRIARLVDAAELAVELRVSTTYVYRNATRLGARRLGAGPKARLRFDLERARTALIAMTEPEPGSLPTPLVKQPPRRRKPQAALPASFSAPAIKPRTRGRLGPVG